MVNRNLQESRNQAKIPKDSESRRTNSIESDPWCMLNVKHLPYQDKIPSVPFQQYSYIAQATTRRCSLSSVKTVGGPGLHTISTAPVTSVPS